MELCVSSGYGLFIKVLHIKIAFMRSAYPLLSHRRLNFQLIKLNFSEKSFQIEVVDRHEYNT